MRGTAGSLREKREAKKAAQRVFGVISVDNQLRVKMVNDEKREDADLRGDELQALMLDGLVASTVDTAGSDLVATNPARKIDVDDLYVSTDNGTVTINGAVSSWAEHDARRSTPRGRRRASLRCRTG